MKKENKEPEVKESKDERIATLKNENVALKRRIGGFIVSNCKYKFEVERLSDLLHKKEAIINGLENQSKTLSDMVTKKDMLIGEWEKNYQSLQDAYMAFVNAPWYKRIFM